MSQQSLWTGKKNQPNWVSPTLRIVPVVMNSSSMKISTREFSFRSRGRGFDATAHCQRQSGPKSFGIHAQLNKILMCGRNERRPSMIGIGLSGGRES